MAWRWGKITLSDGWGSLTHWETGLLGRNLLLWLAFAYGIKRLIKKQLTRLEVSMGVFFIMEWLIISYQGGWQAQAFGGRMYLSSLPLLILWWGMLLDRFRWRWALVAVAIIVNILGMASFILLEKNTERGVRGMELKTRERLEQLWK